MDKYARFRYQPCLPLGKDGRRVTASPEHIELSKRAASEGMVLLKNRENILPLKKGTKAALFGKATVEYISGGGGSGAVYTPYVKNIYDGFREKQNGGKIFLYEPLNTFYKEYVEKESVNIPTDEEIAAVWKVTDYMEYRQEREDITYKTFDSMHVKEPAVPDELIKAAADFSDTALLIISRFSAEGVDRRPVPGDYYLSDTEKQLTDKLCAAFSDIVVIINSGGVVDLEYFENKKQIKAVLMTWQGGIEGGSAVADIITGDINPSGRLPDTVAKSYDSYPGTEDFTESFDYLNFSEDIYVGYRYFETVPGAYDKVRYPFGFGLSYTDFEISDISCAEKEGNINISVSVKNTGRVSGKEVIQVYCAPPQGKLMKPAKNLLCFAKTKLLSPGEKQELKLIFSVNSMASFDDLGKIKKSAFVLEKGEYKIYLGTSVRDVQELSYKYYVDSDRVTEQLYSYCRPFKLEKRLLADGTYEKLPMGEEHYIYEAPEVSDAVKPEKTFMFDDIGTKLTLDEFIKQFTDEELMDFVGGKPPVGVSNTGCFGGMERLGIPAIPTADGPAGLRLSPATGVSTTAWPCATLIAASFDTELAFKIGCAGGAEIRENNIGIWLAPAVNIHRNPLCGRNFEYYSEDPVLAGEIAASQIKGIQSRKAAVSMKHFACNSKESNRYECDSRISERALREIYLKAFRICVEKAEPMTIMSSYNKINGLHTSENYELLTGILRKEWGYKGMVETDWSNKLDPVTEVKAGNDMKMPVGYPEDLKKGFDEGRLTRAELETCVKRILELIIKTAE